MKPTPPLTRFIGEAERTLQALLKHQLDRAGLRFEEWVTLTIVSGATAPDKATLLRQIAAAKVVAPGDEADLLHAMIQRGHIEGDSALALSAEGRAVFEPLRDAIRGITSGLFAELSADDLDTTRRVLETVTQRANQFLAET